MRLVAACGWIVLIGLGALTGRAESGGGPALGAEEIAAPAARSSALVRVAQAARNNQSAAGTDLTQAEVEKLFRPFADAFKKIESEYIDKTDEAKLLRAAIEAMQGAFPAPQQPPAEGYRPGRSSSTGLAAVYATALEILNARPSRDDDAALVSVAIKAMVAALDSRSSYLDAKGFRDMQVQNQGQFGGVGLEVSLENGLVKVVAPIEDSPAAKGDLKTNDLVTHIDGQPVEGLTLNQAVEKMRGPVSSMVRLTVVRGEQQPFDIVLTRAVIRLRSVRPRLEGDDIGLIRLTGFDEKTTELLKKAISDLSAQSGFMLKGFILDLRNNTGGLLDPAISVCDAFLEKGEIVSTRGRRAAATQRYNARAGDLTGSRPLVVLIDGGTAAGAEIVAGALQDHRRATLIGERTAGIGTITTIFPLGSGMGR
jgi:C-terminal peptidase prc